MRLIFPNLQFQEGKTISQLFTVDFMSFLRDNGITIKSVDLNNMEAEIDNEIDLSEFFEEYLKTILNDNLNVYHYTTKMLKRGKVVREYDFTKIQNEQIVKDLINFAEGAKIVDQNEMNVMWHIAKLNLIRQNIDKYRCVQSEKDLKDNKEVCGVCGLIDIKKGKIISSIRPDITERISLVGDKCWKPLGQYEQLKGCVRCAYVLGLIGNLQFLWRINITGKGAQTRYAIVPKFKINTIEPSIIDEINRYLNLLGIFRIRTYGRTSTDYIFNSFRAQPIIAKIVTNRNLDLMIYTQSATGQGGFVTENAISSDTVRKIAEFAVNYNKYFPRDYYYADAGSELDSFPRALSDAVYLYKTKGKTRAWCEFFTQTGANFDVALKVLGGGKMKTEYFKDVSKIPEMKEYEWDNPLVRVSTFFVVERATDAYAKRQRGERARDEKQIINSPMALFNAIPRDEKNTKVRQFVLEITNNGESKLLQKIDEPEKFISEFSEKLNACSPKQLKEISRYMRMFANTFKKRSNKEKYHEETIRELGYSYKTGVLNEQNKEVVK